MSLSKRPERARAALLGALAIGAFAILVCTILSTVPGCNTTEGAGKDIKAAGHGIEKAVSDTK